MSEQQEQARKVLDTDTVLADLAEWWSSPAPSRFSGKVPGRIAGSWRDQPIPEGTRNPYWEIIRQLPLSDLPSLWKTQPDPVTYAFTDGPERVRYFTDRDVLCGTYAWSIPSPGDIAWMRGVLAGRGVAELGAGGGYWAWQMRQAGIDVVAYEPNEPGPAHGQAWRTWATTLRDDHTALKRHPDRALFLCWPTYCEPWAAEALDCYEGDLLIYAAYHDCCADEAFYELLADGWDQTGDSPAHVGYDGTNCRLTAYRRKGTGDA
jgi:hypothetical protein